MITLRSLGQGAVSVAVGDEEVLQVKRLSEGAWSVLSAEKDGPLNGTLPEVLEAVESEVAARVVSCLRVAIAELVEAERARFVAGENTPFEVQVPRPGYYRVLALPELEVLGEVHVCGEARAWFSAGFAKHASQAVCSTLAGAIGRLVENRFEEDGVQRLVEKIEELERARGEGSFKAPGRTTCRR
jgi:hypothetical protein